MKRLPGSAFLLFVLMHCAFAQAPFAPRIEFACGGATVVIDSEPKGFRSPEEAYVQTGKLVQAHIVVARGGSRVAFQSWKDIDYIGGTCVDDANGNPRIVYQAFCGGSSQRCNGTSNWGIIDPVALRELLVPDPGNVGRATEILGKQPPVVPTLISLLGSG
jgi:hypothetical protein